MAQTRTLTLREAAGRTGLSTVTLLRFIRSGRLPALRSDVPGGLLLDASELRRAGLRDRAPDAPSVPGPVAALRRVGTAPARRAEVSPPRPVSQDSVPLSLYRELQMKHEQLLVQYGMVRVGGARLFEVKADAEEKTRRLDEARRALLEERNGREAELRELRARLRRAELTVQERDSRIAGLEAKIRVLELLTRNAVTTESIERRFLEVLEKEREVDGLLLGEVEPGGSKTESTRGEQDH